MVINISAAKIVLILIAAPQQALVPPQVHNVPREVEGPVQQVIQLSLTETVDVRALLHHVPSDDRGPCPYDTLHRLVQQSVHPDKSAALNGVTLPLDDPFWDEYYPPNGWNCRCTVVQVLKATNVPTEREEAYGRAKEALGKDAKGMFRFNPGKQGKAFTDYNPYTTSRCTNCSKRLDLAKSGHDNQLCQACQSLSRGYASKDVTEMLKSLKDRKGADYVKTLREIAGLRIFKPVEKEGIFSAIGKTDPDYGHLTATASKRVSHGYKVYILPNPGSARTADFILSRKNFFGMYDLKTISGQGSVSSRLSESIGQTDRVILNITSQYDPKTLAREIRSYFYNNPEAKEVKVIKGGKIIEVIRNRLGKTFDKDFAKEYSK